jgi:hypothetical protein
MVSAPFAEFTWRHARTLTAQRGGDDANETEVARVLDDLLTRAAAGPVDKRTDRVAARTRMGLTGRPSVSDSEPHEEPVADPAPAGEGTGEGTASEPAEESLATVIPFGVFDVDAEAAKW